MIFRQFNYSARKCLSLLLTVALVVSTSFAALAQSAAQDRAERQARARSPRGGAGNRIHNEVLQENGFVTYADRDQAICRDMSETETQELRRSPQQLQEMRVITRQERAEALQGTHLEAQPEGVNGLTIILRSTAQLDSFPTAKTAFIRAAAQWEAQIKNPISIVIDVDYGPMRFGQPYPSGVLGSTSTPAYIVTYDTLRARLLAGASSAAETTLYNALPTSAMSTDLGGVGTTHVAAPLMRAFGLLAADADPNGTSGVPSIGFNSAFTYDFDPSNGITAGAIDFDAVAVHEMGHALGFISNAGLYELSPGSTRALTVWDVFRFRPGTTMATFTNAARVLSSGGEHRFFDNHPELACSTGRPNGTGGDGRQASHWKADEQSGVYIGIMDPTLSSGQRKTMTSNDLQMLETIGYQIGGTTPPPPTCTYSLSATSAAAGASGGSGTVGVTAGSTCAWTATSNATWLTVTSGTSGTGNGTVGYSVAANTGTTSRTGTLTIAGNTFTVTQAGQPAACSYSVNFGTFNRTFPANGGTVSITVTTASNCTWQAIENVSWLSFNPSTTVTGSRTITLTASRRLFSSSRSTTVTIAGQNLTITQL
jgi:hypothetical protein